MTSKEDKLNKFAVTHSVQGSLFAQIVSLVISEEAGSETATFDFIYQHPGDTNKGQVVARVTIPLRVAGELADVICETLENFRKIKKSETNGNKRNN